VLSFIQDYINPSVYSWQIPFLLAFLAGWLLGGAYLLRWSYRRVMPASKVKFGKFVQVAVFSGLGALVVAGAVAFLVYVIGMQLEVDLRIAAAVVGLVVAFAAAYTIIYGTLNLSFRQAIRIGTPALLAVGALGVVVGVTCVVPALKTRQEVLHIAQCHENLYALAEAFRTYEAKFGNSPESLEELVDNPKMQPPVKKSLLVCPGRPDLPVGYFYRKARSLPAKVIQDGRWIDNPSQKIRLCDYKSNHPKTRNVQFVSGIDRVLREEDFQEMLKRAENFDFGKALQAAEK
jgi:hypothetical protein